MAARLGKVVLLGTAIAMLTTMLAGVGFAKVKITYMSWFAEPGRIEYEQEIVNRFNQSQDEIEVEFLGHAGAISMYEKLLALIAAGTPPDVATINSERGGPIIDKIAADITPYASQDQFSLDAFVGDYTHLVQRDGRLYGVPWGHSEQVLWVNLSRFNEAGIAEPYKGWDIGEFLDATRRLTVDRDGDGTAEQYGWAGGAWQPFIGAFAPPLLDAATEELQVDNPDFVSGVRWFVDLYTDYEVVGGSFENGSAAMGNSFQGLIPIFMRNRLHEQFDWGTSYFPVVEDGEAATYAHGHVMAVIRGSKYPAEAWRFIEFYSSPEAQEILGRASLYPATMAGMRAMAYDFELPLGVPQEQIFGPLITDRPVTIPAYWHIPGAPQVNDLFQAELERMKAEEISVENGLEAIEPQLRAILNESKGKY